MKNKAKLAHRDLKPDNLIIDKFGKRYLLTDFGTTCEVPQQNGKDLLGAVFVGSPLYMAPELYKNYKKYEATKELNWCNYNPFAADVYSLGTIMLTLMGIEDSQVASFKQK